MQRDTQHRQHDKSQLHVGFHTPRIVRQSGSSDLCIAVAATVLCAAELCAQISGGPLTDSEEHLVHTERLAVIELELGDIALHIV